MKLRTKKTLAKRIKISASGKLMRYKITGGHLRVKLASGRKHRNARQQPLNTTTVKNYRRALPGS
ncbi:MAG: 50S ribosomal protein L35 [Patescibacteria group bacterium]